MAYQELVTKKRLSMFINAYSMVDIFLVKNDEPIFVLGDMPDFEDQYNFFNRKIVIHRGKFIWKNDTKVSHTQEAVAHFTGVDGYEGGYYMDMYETYYDYPKQIAGDFHREFLIHRILLDPKIKKDKKYVKPLLDLLKRYDILDIMHISGELTEKHNINKEGTNWIALSKEEHYLVHHQNVNHLLPLQQNKELTKDKVRHILRTPYSPVTNKPSVDKPLRKLTRKQRLTKKQKADYAKYGYRCHDSLHISGTVLKNYRNKVRVKGHTINITDAPLQLLIELVVELKRGKGGWIKIPKKGRDQKIHRLRMELESILKVKDFIENKASQYYKDPKFRISTHPDLITYDKNELLKHSSPSIKALAKKLPKK